MFNFSANLVFYVYQSQPLWFLRKAGSSWQGAQRPHLASSQVAQTLNIKPTPMILPNSTLSDVARFRALANIIAFSMLLLVPIFYWNIFKYRKYRIWSQVVMLLSNWVFLYFSNITKLAHSEIALNLAQNVLMITFNKKYVCNYNNKDRCKIGQSWLQESVKQKEGAGRKATCSPPTSTSLRGFLRF